MRAAADHAEDPRQYPPPRELRILAQLDRRRALWRAGGLADQPARLMRRMALAERCYWAWRGFRDPRPGAWTAMQRNHPEMWALVGELYHMRQKA